MKALPIPLKEALESGATTLAWCWRIARADGEVFGFTEHDRPLSFGGTDYEPESGFSASEIRAGSDLAVDAQEAAGALHSDRITETDILDGRWDNAEIEVWRVNWADPEQHILMRRGNIGQIRRGKAAFVAEVRSLSHVLNQTVGRTYQFYCDAALGDSRCGVDLDNAAFKGTGEIESVTADRAFMASGIDSFSTGWFEFGFIEWQTGANAGRRSEVARHMIISGETYIELTEAPVRSLAAGDDFIIRAGCDKQFTTCVTKFANGINFRGFPNMPGEDAIVRYANRGDKNDGRPL